MLVESLEQRQMLFSPAQNEFFPQDVNDDGRVTALDALNVINALNRNDGPIDVEMTDLEIGLSDVTGDKRVTALDALTVLNTISIFQFPALIGEETAVANTLTQRVSIPSGEGIARLQVAIASKHDASDKASLIDDAVVINVVDPSDPARRFVAGLQPGGPLFTTRGLNAEFSQATAKYDGQTLEIDLSTLGELTEVDVVISLVSTDADRSSRVRVGEPRVVRSSAPFNSNTALPLSDQAATVGDAVNLASYEELNGVQFRSRQVDVNPDATRLTAEVQLVATSGPIGRSTVVALPNLATGVNVVGASGTDTTHGPYFNLRTLIPAGGLLPGQASQWFRVEFELPPGAARPNFNPVVLTTGPNRAPVITSTDPIVANVGAQTTVQLTSTDADGDTVRFRLMADPSLPTVTLSEDGRLTIDPKPNQVGTYTLEVIATDSSASTKEMITLTVGAETGATRIIGTVLDTDDKPLAGIPVQIGRFAGVTNTSGQFTIELPSFLVPTESFDVLIPTGDPQFDPMATGTQRIVFHRAAGDPTTGTGVDNPLNHKNLVSAFLDASVVYGSDPQRAAALRTGDNTGRLKTDAGGLLPTNSPANFPNGVLENENNSQRDPATLFAAGDVRTNDNVTLMALHTLLVREHNRRADELRTASPSLTGDQVYEAARRWVSALIQHITYQEFLPHLLGNQAINAYTGYDATVDPQVSPLFSVAAMRIGHTLTPEMIDRLGPDGTSLDGGSLTLAQTFFNVDAIRTDGIEPYLRGAAIQLSSEIDARVTDPLRNFLFGPPGAGGMDLVSMNLQRSRDMGLPTYNATRAFLGLDPVTRFDQITSNAETASRLAAVYRSVDKVDLWAGGLAEDHVDGSLVGETFGAILIDQFTRQRDGDRFWYENGVLTTQELAQLRSMTLADVIVLNTDIEASELPSASAMGSRDVSGPAAAGTAATAAPPVRPLDGRGNNASDPNRGVSGTNLRVDYPVGYGDGVSTPAGSDRPNVRAISNTLFAEESSTPSQLGATVMLTIWGQLVAHDLSLTPGGTDDEVRVFGNRAVGQSLPYPFVAERIPLLLERPVYPGFDNVLIEPIYLPAIDMANAVEIDPTKTTMVSSPAIPGTMLEVTAGNLVMRNGQPFDEMLSITRVPPDRLPMSLPDTFDAGLVVTFQPAGMRFLTPAAVTFPNLDDLPSGTETQLISIDPDTGAFEVVGRGRVSADGSVIETIEGGITTTSWHFAPPLPPIPDPKRPEDRNDKDPFIPEGLDDRDGDIDTSGNSSSNTTSDRAVEPVDVTGSYSFTQLSTGNYIETHELVGYSSQSEYRSIELRYESLRVDTRPIVALGFDNLSRLAANALLVGQLELSRGDTTIPILSEMAGNEREHDHIWQIPNGADIAYGAIQADMRNQASGTYNYRLMSGIGRVRDLERIIPGNDELSIARRQLLRSYSVSFSETEGVVQVVNLRDSALGAGWSIDRWEQVIQNPDGSLLLIGGSGRETFFGAPELPDGPYISPASNKDRMVREATGNFIRTTVDGTRYTYRKSDGQLISETNRLNRTWNYVYDSSGRLVTITDPADQVTTLAYTAGRIASITDPANRKTLLEHDTSGNLTKIIDPDGSARTFTYDAEHRMTGERTPRGFQQSIEYGYHGRPTGGVGSDGSSLRFSFAQTVGLAPPAIRQTLPIFDAPQAATERPNVGQKIEADGRIYEVALTSAGRVESAGYKDQPRDVFAYDKSGNVISRTTAEGFTTQYLYDDLGNQTGKVDSLSIAGSVVEGNLRSAAQTDRYAFTLSEPTSVFFDLVSASNDLAGQSNVELVDATGRVIFSVSANALHQPFFDGRLGLNTYLLQSGSYELRFRATGTATDAYQFRMLDISNAPRLALGSAVQLSAADPRFSQAFTFVAPDASRRVELRTGANQGASTFVTLIDPLGAVVNQPFQEILDSSLLVPGATYTLLVFNEFGEAPPETSFDASIALIELMDESRRSIQVGETVEAIFSTTAARHSFDLTLDKPSLLYIDAIAVGQVGFEITGPSGVIASGDLRAINANSEPLPQLAPGTYRIRLDRSSLVDAAQLARFRVIDVASANVIAVNTPTPITLDPSTSTAIRKFTATANQVFTLDVDDAEGGTGQIHILGPDGDIAYQNGSLASNGVTILAPVTGTYTLVVEGSLFTSDVSTTSLNLTLKPQTPATPVTGTAITRNTIVNGSISISGERDRMVLDLTAPEVFVFDALTNQDNFEWTATDAFGNETQRNFFSSTENRFAGSAFRLSAGRNVITVDASQSVTGNYSFRLLSFNSAESISLDTASSVTLSPAKGSRLYKFDVSAGSNVLVRPTTETVPIRYRVFAASGEQLEDGTLEQNASIDDAIRFESAGTYFIVFDGQNDEAGESQSFDVRLDTIATLNSIPITLDQVVSRTQTRVGQTDLYDLVIEAPTYVRFDSRTDLFDLQYTLRSEFHVVRSDNFAFEDSSGSANSSILLLPGTYTLEIQDQSFDVGATSNAPVDYSFSLVSFIGAIPWKAKEVIRLQRSPANAAVAYSIDAQAGDQLALRTIDVDSVATNAFIYSPDGSLIANPRVGVSGNSYPLPMTGRYTVVFDSPVNAVDLEDLQVVYQLNKPNATTLTLGQTVQATIESPLDVLHYQFTIDEPKSLYFDSLVAVPNMFGELNGPFGQVFSTFTGGTNGSEYLHQLPPGRYTLTFSTSGDPTQVGVFSFRMLDLTTVPSFALDADQTIAITPPTGVVARRVLVEAGQELFFEGKTLVGSSSVSMRLVRPDGVDVLTTGLSEGSTTETGTLPVSGDYLLLFDISNSETETTTVTLSANVSNTEAPEPLTGTSIELGEVVDGVIDEDFGSQKFRFTLDETTSVLFDVISTETTGLAISRLRGPNSDRLVSSNLTNIANLNQSPEGLVQRLPAGEYELTIEDQVSAPGAFSFRLVDLEAAATSTSLASPVNASAATSHKTQVFSVSALEDDQLSMRLDTSTGDLLTFRILDAFGREIPNSGTDGINAEYSIKHSATYFVLVDTPPDFSDSSATLSLVIRKIIASEQADLAFSTSGSQTIYDAATNRPVRFVDAAGRRTDYVRDAALGLLLERVLVVGLADSESSETNDIATQFTYTTDSLLESITAPDGLRTEYQYDGSGRVARITYAADTADAISQSYTYDAAGNLLSFTDFHGAVTNYAYDARGRLVRVTTPDPDGTGPRAALSSTFEYDAAGNLVRQVNFDGQEFENRYDAKDRLTFVKGAGGLVTRLKYDTSDRLVEVIDPLENRSIRAYDASDRLVSTTDAGGSQTQYVYDASDRLVSLTDSLGNTNAVVRDGRGRVIESIDATGATTRLQYNVIDQLVRRTDALRRVTEFDYDRLGNIVTERWLDDAGTVVDELTFEYDTTNRLLSSSQNDVELTYAYDVLGRITRSTTDAGIELAVEYAYDDGGRLNVMREFKANTLQSTTSYSYDAIGNLTAISRTGTAHNASVGFQFDANGRRSVTRLHAGAITTTPTLEARRAYNATQLLTGIEYTSGQTTIADIDYTYDARSFLASESAFGVQSQYSYDGFGQLLAVRYSGTSKPADETYAYDSQGNRSGASNVIADANRLTADETFDYEYDVLGQMTKRIHRANGNVDHLVYDHRGRITEILTRDDADEVLKTLRFTYDALNRRVAEQTDAAITYLVHDGFNLLSEYVDPDGAGAQPAILHERYLHGPGIDEVLAQQSPDELEWLVTDIRGSVRGVASASGQLLTTLAYDAYGNPVDGDQLAGASRFGYTGREWFGSVDLYHYRERMYDPHSGRFLSQDPLGFAAGDTNLYRYAGNNPINFRDPFGLASCDVNTKPKETKTPDNKFDPVEFIKKQAENTAEGLKTLYDKYKEATTVTIDGQQVQIQVVPNDITNPNAGFQVKVNAEF